VGGHDFCESQGPEGPLFKLPDEWGHRKCKSGLGCVWLAVVGELWNHRNRKVFRNGRVDHIEIFAMSQVKAWSWVASKAQGVCFSFSDWCFEPMVCMRSVILRRNSSS